MKQTLTILALFLSLYAIPAFGQCPPPGFPSPGDTCPEAPILCEDLDGYCATINDNNIQQTFPGCPGNVLNNDEWFAFYAGSTTISIEIVPTNCTSAPPNQGLQAAMYYGCGGPVMDTQCGCSNTAFVLSANNFIVGEIYWIVVDGCGGDVCDYTVNVIEGNTVGNQPDDPGAITGDQVVCQDDITTYSVPPVEGATLYNWEMNPLIGSITNNGNTVDITWPVPGSTTLCLTVANACFGNPTEVCYDIDVEPNPTAIINPAGDITCVTSEVILNGAGSSTGGNFSYQWSTTDGNIVSGGNTLNPTVNQDGTYNLLVTNDLTGCTTETDIIVVEDTALPVADAGQDLELNCALPQIPLSGFGSSGPPGMFSYQWTTNDGNIVSGATTQAPFVDEPGTYTITVTNTQNGCVSTDEVVVTQNADAPLADAGPEQFIDCVANEVILDGTNSSMGPNFTYVWTTADGNIVSGGNTLEPLVDQSGTYQLLIFNGSNGCSDTSEVTVDIDVAPPVIDIEPPVEIDCTNPQIVIDASGSSSGGNFTYTWTTSDGNIISGDDSLMPEVDLAGTYTLTITNTDNGCTEVSTVDITGDVILPFVDIIAPPTLSCTDPQVILDASGSDSGPQYTYTWSTTDGTISSGGDGPMPTVTSAGTYELTVLNTNTNCATTETVTVDADADQPFIMLDPVDELNCSLEEFELNANIGGGQNLTFTWATADGNFVSGTNTLQPLIDAAGTYELTVINDDNGCEEISSVTVTEDFIIPQTDAGPDGELTCSVLTLDLDGSNSDTGGSIVYQWSTPDGNIITVTDTTIIEVDAPGTYVLETVNTDNTCESSDTVVVTENVSIIDSEIEPPILMGCADPTIILDGSASTTGGTITYTWTTPDGNIINGDDTSTPEIDAPGTYTLLVYDTSNDCFDEEQTTVVQNTDVPVIDAGPDGSITCTETTVELQGDANGQIPNFVYEWTTADGNIASGGSTLNPIVDLEGTYTLTVTDTINQCTATESVDVVQDADVPITAVTASNPFNCDFNSVTLDGSGSTQGADIVYTWSTPDGNIIDNPDDFTAVVDQAGSYTLVVNDTVSFCMSSTTFTVTPDTISPNISIASPDELNCDINSVILDSEAGGLPDININWSTSDGNIVADDNTFNPTVDQPGTYTLVIVNNENGCASQTEVVVPSDFVLPIVDAGATDVINCFNPSISLNGSADAGGDPVDYLWSTADGNIVSDGDTPSPVVDAGGTYQLQVTNTDNGCINTSDVLIDFDQTLPVVDPGQPGLLNCYNPQIQLDGSGSSAGAEFEYTWSTSDGNILGGADTQNPDVDAVGTYTLTIFNNDNGCEDMSTVVVDEDFTDPTVDAGMEEELSCSVTELMLDGTADVGPNFTYSWSTVDGNIVAGGNTLNPEIDLPGTYILEVFNIDNGCSATSQTEVTLNADFPIVSAAADEPITCTETTVVLDGTGTDVGANFTYDWSTVDGNILNGGTSLNPTVDQAGTYTLMVTNVDNDCVSTTDVDVQIDTILPMAEAGNPELLTCTVTQLNLSGVGSSAGPDFSYLWTTADGNIIGGPDAIDPLIDEPGTYEILVTDLTNGCESTDLVTIDEDVELPTAVSAVNDILTCETLSLNLDGTGSSAGPEFVYNWTTADGNILNGGTSLNPEIDEPGTYTLIIENMDNGCVEQTSVTVDEDVTPPTLLIANPNLLTCTILSVDIDASASSSGANFLPVWSTLNGNIVSGANSLQAEVDEPGTYTLLIENDDNGCTTQEDVVVQEDVELPTVDAGAGFVLPCNEDEVLLDGTATANSTNLQFEWTTADGVLENNTTSLSPVISTGGTYNLLVTNLDNGCENSDEVTITEDNPTDPDVDSQQPLCSDDLGVIEVSNVEAGSPPYIYSIDNGETFFSSPVFVNLDEGDYNVMVQDALGCESGVVQAFIDVPEPVEIFTETEVEVLQGESYQIDLIPLNFMETDIQSITWTPTEGLDCTDCLNPIASPLQSTVYTVEIIVAGDCRTLEEVNLVVDERPAIYAPNIFSPDDDGVNDLFYLFGRETNINRIRTFLVLDRWGETVHSYQNFQPNDPAAGWDGTHRGKRLNPGVFVWYAEVELIDGRVEIFKGDITIVR